MSDLAQRFNYHPATTQERRDAHEEIRNASLALATDVERFVPEGRERALAITKIEEAMFWANAAIARQPAEEEPVLRIGARVRVTDAQGGRLAEARNGQVGDVVGLAKDGVPLNVAVRFLNGKRMAFDEAELAVIG